MGLYDRKDNYLWCNIVVICDLSILERTVFGGIGILLSGVVR